MTPESPSLPSSMTVPKPWALRMDSSLRSKTSLGGRSRYTTDETVAFVTSANLTEKAFDENIEVGVLSRDRTLAMSLAKHFRVLIERELLVPLPSA